MTFTRRSLLSLAAAAPLPWLLPAPARAATTPVCAPEGLALGGRDAVAYFEQGKPVTGNRAYALQWRGALWLFASSEAMEQFEMTPRAYAPRYGGYCAMSMASGMLADGDPGIWEIHDDRLYLISTVAKQKMWDSDVAGNVARADRNWPTLLGG